MMNLDTAAALGARLARNAASVPLGHADPKVAAIQRDIARLNGVAAALATAEVQGAPTEKLATVKALAVAELRRVGAELDEVRAWERHRSGS